MKNKVIALIMIIPILFLVTIFSLGKVAGFFVDIPVSGINIVTQNQDGFIVIDLAKYQNDIYMQAKVEPSNANNQVYNFVIEGVDGKEPADIEIEQDGRLIAKGDGKAKITAISADKGFADSVIVIVHSTKVLQALPQLKDNGNNSVPINGQNGNYEVTVNGGLYNFDALLYPSELADANVSWISSNSNVIEINSVTGKAKAKLSGSAVVSLLCPDALKGEMQRVDVNVTVVANKGESGLSIDGMVNNTLLCSTDSQSVEFLVERTDDKIGAINVVGVDAGQITSKSVVALDDTGKRFKVTLNFSASHGSQMQLRLQVDGNLHASDLVVNFADRSFAVYTSYHKTVEDTIYQRNLTKVTYWADCEPYEEGIRYVWSIDDASVSIIPSADGNSCAITASKTTQGVLNIQAYKGNIKVGEINKQIRIVADVYSIEFVDNSHVWGIENIKAVAGYAIKNGRYVDNYEQVKILMRMSDGNSYYQGSDLVFESSDTGVIRPYKMPTDFRVNVVGQGVATIKAKWAYADYFGVNISSSLTLRSVEGVKVDDYNSLVKATGDGKQIVLDKDIYLGEEGASVEQLRSQLKTMETSYDYAYYINTGKTRPVVNYLVEFKNNVYGNGYTLNAERFTQAVDANGNPLLFKGPLDFVAISTASVKAQDNIAFLVRTDGVIIDNVHLKSCDDPITDGLGFDFTKLNHVGTTLEVAADCDIVNSRISNGRTVVRIFGGDINAVNPIVTDQSQVNAEQERVVCNISSCVLSNAREFIVKIGSNRAVLHNGTNQDDFALAKLLRRDGTAYPSNHNAVKESEKKAFYDDCVLTDATIKDSVLSTSGLFSVGMESHFGEIMLSGFVSGFSLPGWSKLACTSFASKLSLEGDVKMLDWKDINKVDSSTLIETTGGARDFLNLNVSAMLDKLSSKEGYDKLVDTQNGTRYVHGGVVFYGGGYNYSYCDFAKFEGERLSRYDVNLSILAEGEEDTTSPLYLQGTMLPLAAGPSDFVFYMYDSTSDFDYNKQLDYQNGRINIKPTNI